MNHRPRTTGRARLRRLSWVRKRLRPLRKGGQFPGLYASFHVKDSAGDHQIYRIGFFGTGKWENHPVFGNRRSTSILMVAIDDFDAGRHASLELCLDEGLQIGWRHVALTHNGSITVGRLGAARRDLLLDYVKEHAPHLIRRGRVYLGKVRRGRVLRFADAEKLFFNLLHYAHIRDRFRAWYRRRRRRQ